MKNITKALIMAICSLGGVSLGCKQHIHQAAFKRPDGRVCLNGHYTPQNVQLQARITISTRPESDIGHKQGSGLPTGTTIAVPSVNSLIVGDVATFSTQPTVPKCNERSTLPGMSHDECQSLATNASWTSTTTEPNSFLQFTEPYSRTRSIVRETSDDHKRMSIRALPLSASSHDLSTGIIIQEFLGNRPIHPEFSWDLQIGDVFKYRGKLFEKISPTESIQILDHQLSLKPQPSVPVDPQVIQIIGRPLHPHEILLRQTMQALSKPGVVVPVEVLGVNRQSPGNSVLLHNPKPVVRRVK